MTNQEITITDSAAKRIAYLISVEDQPNSKLRISVEGGGCSGFKYNYEFFASDNNPDDSVFTKDNAIIVIDSVSMEFMNGAVVDYVESLEGAYFQIKNPNSSSSCGCGNSFAV